MSTAPLILVVDDRALNRHFLVTLLGYSGYRSIEAADGAEALAAARVETPALVISDILMPVMDGEEFVREMRRDPVLASVPVIFYTATFQARDAKRIADSCGVQSVIPKPADPETILAAVTTLLGPAALPAPPAADARAPVAGERGAGGIGERVAVYLRNLEGFHGEIGAALAEGRQAATERDQLRALCESMKATAARLQSVPLKLASLVEFGMSVTGNREPDTLLELFIRAAQDILGVGIVGVGVLDESGTGMDRFMCRGVPPSVGPPAVRAGVFGEVLSQGRPRLVDARGKNPASLGLPEGHPVVRSLLVVPLMGRSAPMGWLYLADPVSADAFDSVDEQIATTLASQFAVASEDARLHAEVQSHAGSLRLEVAARRAAEERYRSLFEEAAEGIIRVSVDQRILDANPAMVRILGFDSEDQFRAEIVNFETQVVVDAADCAAFHEAIAAKGRVVNFESRFRRRDGKPIAVRVHVSAVRTQTGELRAFEGMVTDITMERSLQEQLHHAMRVEAVGRLAGGVAHDFNNLLMVILGQASLILPRVAEDEKVRQGLVDIQEAGQRAATLTRQLLAFSRKQVLQPSLLNPNDILRNLDKMLRRVIGEDVILENRLAEDSWSVLVDPGQLEQVIVNLAVNARDAMPTGGRLTMETRNVALAPSLAPEAGGIADGDYVCISVSDNGTGMPEEVRRRVFEPFFTTKGEGKGTGLGLATSYGIARQSGGNLTVYSEVGQGTTFKVYLPRAVLRGPAAVEDAATAEIPTGSETVLLVEDEGAVRKLTRCLLEGQGYTVVEASSGPEALRILERGAKAVQLLLTDTIMPSMNGRVLAQKALAIYPDLKVIFMSGYTDDAVVRHGILAKEVAFLQKPFTPRDLAVKMREVLDGKQGRAG